MKTPLCQVLGIEAPVILAAMGGVDAPRLAAAVANAGGLGMMALWFLTPEGVRSQIAKARSLTDRPFGVNLNLAYPQTDQLAACLAEGVKVISLFWGDPGDLVAQAHAGGAVVLHTVGSAAEARRSAALGVDVVVAQGWEAGGHVWGEVASLPLIPAVVDAVAPIPVVAAGGIADGRGLAAVLALGAQAAWIGTRFLTSAEAGIHPRYQAMLLAADEASTAHTGLFDIGWPDAPHRVLRNSTLADWEAAGRPPRGSRPREGEVIGRSPRAGEVVAYRSFTPARETEGDIEAMSLWAGQGVGLANAVKPAGEIVREIVAEADSVLSALGGGQNTERPATLRS
jgi:NAD(P)H-dependent flavin oxidoreductase YrpB (nitropropane dioxygenase family)